MKYTLILCIFSITSINAQTVLTVENLKGEKLAGVSVFDTSNKNKLAGISSNEGSVNLSTPGKYTLHYLGYQDTLVELSGKTQSIAMRELGYSLPEIKIGKNKSKVLSLTEKADFLPSYSEALGGLRGRYYQKLCSVTIPKEGSLKSFSLVAHKEGEGEIDEQIALLLYDDVNGKPGQLLISKKIPGIFKDRRLYFNAADYFVYLPQGKYFIGYENYNYKDVSATKTPSSKPATIFIEYRKTKSPELFVGSNLSKLHPFTFTNPGNNKTSFYSFGYELEMDVPVKN